MCGLQSKEVDLAELRKELRRMSEYELVTFGKAQREVGRPNELQEARKEWRRRHPWKPAIEDREL
jgi:hypothetical protein